MSTVRSIVGLWRWRGNALCRRSDRREAWIALWAAVVVLVGAPLAGWLTAASTHGVLVGTAHRQHAERQRVWATVEEVLVLPPADTDPQSSTPEDRRTRVIAQWAGPDGSSHKGAVQGRPEMHPGEQFLIWTDGKGRVTSRPLSVRSAEAHSALAGLAAAAAAAAGVEAVRRLAMRRVMIRRYARWDDEWRRIGPDWGRTGTSN